MRRNRMRDKRCFAENSWSIITTRFTSVSAQRNCSHYANALRTAGIRRCSRWSLYHRRSCLWPLLTQTSTTNVSLPISAKDLNFALNWKHFGWKQNWARSYWIVDLDSCYRIGNGSTGRRVGVLSTENEDVRSLRELIVYGLKGMAAYLQHANNLGADDKEIHAFIQKALVVPIFTTMFIR